MKQENTITKMDIMINGTDITQKMIDIVTKWDGVPLPMTKIYK